MYCVRRLCGILIAYVAVNLSYLNCITLKTVNVYRTLLDLVVMTYKRETHYMMLMAVKVRSNLKQTDQVALDYKC